MSSKRTFETMGSLAASLGVDKATFWAYLSVDHQVDMLQLGWQPNRNAIPPQVCEYIREVVFGRKSRLTEFPNLKTLRSAESG